MCAAILLIVVVVRSRASAAAAKATSRHAHTQLKQTNKHTHRQRDTHGATSVAHFRRSPPLSLSSLLSYALCNTRCSLLLLFSPSLASLLPSLLLLLFAFPLGYFRSLQLTSPPTSLSSTSNVRLKDAVVSVAVAVAARSLQVGRDLEAAKLTDRRTRRPLSWQRS